jgi:hypothetical protein
MDEKYKKLLIHPDKRSSKDIDELKVNLQPNPYLKEYLKDHGDKVYTQLIKMAYYEFIPKG